MTLSDTAIDSDKKQPDLQCLSCYLAGKGPPSDTSYHEHYSYLNDSPPFKHATLRETNKFAGKSNQFYVGCNTDSFMTLCLEIQRSTNTVTLSHAGPNAIYNQQKISCAFKKSQLDLTTLNYLHLTSGSRTVPVRNLTISFEKQMDLHPTYDKNFKKQSPSSATLKADEKARNAVSGDENSTLTPCVDNVNCLSQHSQRYGASHNAQYSHPCPYSELCCTKEPNFTHEPHLVSMCKNDTKCNQLTDPFHRAEYRHTDLPDFLVPCRYQEKCYEKSPEHRVAYSHGERVYKNKESTSSLPLQTPCKWGSRCRDIRDDEHRKKYSHPATDQLSSDDSRADDRHLCPCRYGAACHDYRAHHRSQYSHPEPKTPSDSDDDDL